MFKEVMNGQTKLLNREQIMKNAEVEEMKKELLERAEALLVSLDQTLPLEKVEAILRIAALRITERVNKKTLGDIL